jgi:hypothetical protein
VVCLSQSADSNVASDPLLFPSWVSTEGRYLLNLVAGYFDESTDVDTQGFCYTVAGFVAAQDASVVLELRWRDLLTEYELDYFKASELNAGLGQFQKFRDTPDATEWRPFSKREKGVFLAIKTRFTDVIAGCRGLHGIGATVILPDYVRLLETYENAKNCVPLPYYLCQGMVLMHAGMMMQKTNETRHSDKVFLRPIFDSHEQYSGQAKLGFDDFCAKNPRPAQYLLPLHYEREQDYLTLQAADNLAFEARKVLFNEENNPHLPQRVSMARIKEKSDSTVQIYRFDYKALKVFMDLQISGPDQFLQTWLEQGGSFWELRDIFMEIG